jgi:protoporphyrinogen/coproporphyrinogen III oxidase
MKRIAIVGGGIAGVAAAYELARLRRDGAAVEAVLFEASPRLGGIVETVREAGFTVEGGPDGWVTEKPWARELAEELGLGAELMPSNDATRKTYLVDGGEGDTRLVAMPDGMRMMVPLDLEAMDRSPLFTEAAKAAYREEIARAEELRQAAPETDESVAEFVRRHFGDEVLEKVGAPLLSGVFGGDVTKLSVRAVMAPFVAMEREHGSLINGLTSKGMKAKTQARGDAAATAAKKPGSLFTTLRSGLGTLIDAMVATIPAEWLRCNCGVVAVRRVATGWEVETAAGTESFEGLMLAVPVDVAGRLLRDTDQRATELMALEASSAVVVGFGFDRRFALPQGFGFLVPPKTGAGAGSGAAGSSLLAGTFMDQKFDDRVPEGGRLLRGFFGGATADGLLGRSDAEIAALARKELEAVLKLTLPEPVVTVVRRWPRALPQYAVGHLERMEELSGRVGRLGGLWLLGNGYRGVGLPDLVRDGRAAAREAAR